MQTKRLLQIVLLLALLVLTCAPSSVSLSAQPMDTPEPDYAPVNAPVGAPVGAIQAPPSQGAPTHLATTITVSGTVTGPGGPVPDVWISIYSPQDRQETTTNASGFYSVTIQTEGQLWFDVRPAVSTRLTQISHWISGATGNLTQDFTVTNGHLLSLRLTGAGGAQFTGNLGLEILPLQGQLSEGWWYRLYWDESSQRRQAVLPYDIYYIRAHHLPAGYYETIAPFDLRAADQIQDMPLNTTYVHPIPYEPPDASKITIGLADLLGEATVTGAPGAALPLARVLLVNLSSAHQAHTISETDGHFTARIYAPPGSFIMVKHGPASARWADLEVGLAEGVNPFPGTILYVPHTHTGEPGSLSFAAAGVVQYNTDDANTTRNYVGAAWAMTGTIGPGGVFTPGETFQVTGTLRLYSPAITTTTDVGAISIAGRLCLMMQHDAAGRPIASIRYYMSTLLTPSGFPIQSAEWPIERLNTQASIGNLHYLGGHAIEGDLTATGQLPNDLPPGIYRPVILFNFSGVPTSTNWLAANVTFNTFTPIEAALPPIQVGQVDPPRLAWQLLADDFVQGTRGTSARENKEDFGLSSQIVFQGAPYYTPPVDERTGQSITYRLEPFLPMISFTDRRLPAPPLMPFDLPSGMLHVVIEEPDGTVRDLGAEPFAQSSNRTKTTRAGADLNPGTVQLEDVYALNVASDRFRTTFDQYGHHVITMTGTISDVWGNAYTGGGTYDLWVAYPLDFDPGVLPGTPLAVGDAFNPAIQFYPRVPAEVFLTVSLYPNSDPDQVIRHTRSGQANRYGYFSSATPITLTEPGELRVDVKAVFEDSDGVWYMGTMTWGGVVMTPASDNPQLVAHGRRGLDALLYCPASAWFVHTLDLTLPPTGTIVHTLNPYFSGDLIWSRMLDKSPIGGDALVLSASVYDTVGIIETAIVTRAQRMNPELQPPCTFSERVAQGELPLFISTRSGRWPAMADPSDWDQIAYSYRSSQRPGVRIRELVSEDRETAGYWRLDTLYDDQLGVGVLGDLPNDFKFQYIGVVYRDLDTGHSEYLGQGTGWVFIPDDDLRGSRVMPPFAGPGNGGWTTMGGPIMTLKGQDIHIFILPTGVLPGAVLEEGDTFRFAGHIMPTLNSRVAVTVTAPSGVQYVGGGQANSVGYFYDPADDFVVNEAGLWSVDVRVWHDGQCSGGQTVPPYPSGDVLGSKGGRYWFYVVPPGAPPLHVGMPTPGFLRFVDQVTPITVTGVLPPGLTSAAVDYTISMPGFILQHGQVTPSGNSYAIGFDPLALSQDFPNLDLTGRDSVVQPGLADTFSIGLFLRGQRGADTIYQANTITIQGEQVFVEMVEPPSGHLVHLPLVLRNSP